MLARFSSHSEMHAPFFPLKGKTFVYCMCMHAFRRFSRVVVAVLVLVVVVVVVMVVVVIVVVVLNVVMVVVVFVAAPVLPRYHHFQSTANSVMLVTACQKLGLA